MIGHERRHLASSKLNRPPGEWPLDAGETVRGGYSHPTQHGPDVDNTGSNLLSLRRRRMMIKKERTLRAANNDVWTTSSFPISKWGQRTHCRIGNPRNGWRLRMGKNPKTSFSTGWKSIASCRMSLLRDGAAMPSSFHSNPTLTFMADHGPSCELCDWGVKKQEFGIRGKFRWGWNWEFKFLTTERGE